MTFHLTHFRNLRRPAAIGLLAASLLVSLAACGGDTSGASAPPPAAATAAPADTGAAGAAATPAMDMTAEAPAAGAAGAAPTTAAAGATNAVEIKATLREWALDLSQTEVPAGPVHFVISNAGQMAHNFTIKGDSGVLGKTANFTTAQGAQSVDVTLTPGTYTVYCSLPGHADRGQKNTLIVK